jgi:hypothetical protein
VGIVIVAVAEVDATYQRASIAVRMQIGTQAQRGHP